MLAAPLALALAIMTSLSACAINDTGMARVDRFENEYGYFVRTQVWGLHVTTVASDEGLTLGFSDRAYFIPKVQPTEAAPLSKGIRMEKSTRMTRTDAAPLPVASLGAPVSIRSKDVGLRIGTGPAKAGITLGLNSNARLRLDSSASSVVRVRFDSDDEEALRFYFKGVVN